MSKKYLLVAIYLIFFILVLVSASDTTLPDIDFTNPTPSNGSSQSGDSIYVNVSTNDSSEHYAFVDFDKSLVLWIRGDDTNQSAGTLGAMFYDLSTYGMNGTAIGNATLNSGGRFGSAFQFNVTNGYVNVNTAGLTGASPKNETFSLWIKSDSTANRGIFEDGNSLVDASPQRLMQISTNKIRVLPCNAAYSGSTTTSITPGIWYHVAWVRNGTSNKIYINGTQEVDSAITNSGCQEFFLDVASPEDSTLVLWEKKGNDPSVPLTSKNLKINFIRFSINGSDGSADSSICHNDPPNKCGASNEDTVQPKVTILLNVKIPSDNQEQERTIQTTVSQRNLNK